MKVHPDKSSYGGPKIQTKDDVLKRILWFIYNLWLVVACPRTIADSHKWFNSNAMLSFYMHGGSPIARNGSNERCYSYPARVYLYKWRLVSCVS